MGTLLVRMRKQDAVYWAPAGVNADTVETLATPVDLKVRMVVAEVTDFAGTVIDQTTKGSGHVYTGQGLAVGGYVRLGTVAGLSAPDVDPRTLSGAYRVRQTEVIPNLRNTQTLYYQTLE